MGDIVRLSEYREKIAFKEGLTLWRRRFKVMIGPTTRLDELDAPVLCRLADPSEANNQFLYNLILAFGGHGLQASFYTVDKRIQIRIVDVHLFLTDQIRFEIMRRLGWLSRFCATRYPLFELIRQFDHIRILCQQDPPALSEHHSHYAEYQSLTGRDRQVFIRRMLPSALDAFKKEGLPDRP